jgi:hypothetical protein
LNQSTADPPAFSVLVISAREGSRPDTVGCGKTLSIVLLEATVAGLANCTLTHCQQAGASWQRQPDAHWRRSLSASATRLTVDSSRRHPRRALADVLTIKI